MLQTGQRVTTEVSAPASRFRVTTGDVVEVFFNFCGEFVIDEVIEVISETNNSERRPCGVDA